MPKAGKEAVGTGRDQREAEMWLQLNRVSTSSASLVYRAVRTAILVFCPVSSAWCWLVVSLAREHAILKEMSSSPILSVRTSSFEARGIVWLAHGFVLVAIP
jgi:hypothetical protein